MRVPIETLVNKIKEGIRTTTYNVSKVFYAWVSHFTSIIL